MKSFNGYFVTKQGELIHRLTGAIKYTWNNKGKCAHYERAQFIIDGKPKNFYVHRIVAMTYLENYHESLVVNHIDGNTLNNALSNLEMVSQSVNLLKYYESEAHKVLRGSKCIFKSGLIQSYQPSQQRGA